MDVQLINPVLASMISVLATMAELELRPGRPRLKENAIANGAVTGILKITGEGVNGSMAISFSRPVILELCRRVLHSEPNDIDEMVADLAGEIANMVTGAAKGVLEERGYKVELSLPTVLFRRGHNIDHDVEAKTILLPFKCKVGELFVELCFDYSDLPNVAPDAGTASVEPNQGSGTAELF
jgi:chemotaxis protein CheX